MKQSEINIFSGGLNQDAALDVIPKEDYTSAFDIQGDEVEQRGIAVNAPGNSQSSYPAPASGIDTVVNTFEDKQTASLIIFVRNSNNNHRVIRYSLLDGSYTVVLSGSILNFDASTRVTHAAIVDGKLLYWTDARPVQDTVGVEILDGNPLRCTDMERANPTKDYYIFDIHCGIEGEGQFANGNTYAFFRSNYDGSTTTATTTFTADGTYLDDPEGGAEWLRQQLVATYAASMTVTRYGTHLNIIVNAADNLNRLQMTASDGDILLICGNVYPLTIAEHHIDMVKVPPTCAPGTEFIRNNDIPGNSVLRGCFQFRYRYLYYNGEYSAYSPVSNMALAIDINGQPYENLNGIRVMFNDERLNDVSWLSMIRRIEVCFRDGNDGLWKLAKNFGTYELGVTDGNQYYDFFNNEGYSVIASDDVSSNPNTQVIKNFDWLPNRALCLAASANDDGNTLMFIGAGEELYDNPVGIDMDVYWEEYSDPNLIDIIGTVEIINQAAYPTANPDYDYYPLGGFVVYIAGTNYFGISNNPADGTGDGSFIIKNVPRGKYLLRVASFRCGYNDDKSPRYNLLNGLEWQRTSAPCQEVAGTTGFECELNTVSFVGDTFDLDTEVGYGAIKIYNGHYSVRDSEVAPGGNVVNLNEFYVLDNGAVNVDADDRIAAINCERQLLEWSNNVSVDLDQETDHNGYQFIIQAYVKGSVVTDATISVLHSTTPAKYRGDYDALYNDTLTTITDVFASYSGGVYFVINTDSGFTARKRVNEFMATDANGGPVVGALFFVERTTRFDRTNIQGVAKITCYYPYDDVGSPNDTVRGDAVYVLLEDVYDYNEYPTNPLALNMQNVSTDPDPIPPLALPAFQFLFASQPVYSRRFFKGGGSYKYGIVYEDRANRTPGAIAGGEVRIPAHPGGLKQYKLIFSIGHQPPVWATHYRIVRTRNGVHGNYVQWGVKSVKYVRVPSSNDDPIDTTFAAGDATHIFLELYTPETGAAFQEFWPSDGQISYLPEDGDRVRLLIDNEGQGINTDAMTYETPVVGIYTDAGKRYAAIQNVFGDLEILQDFIVEYYSPSQVTDVYYEGGEDCYEIINPGQSNRRHAGGFQDQSFTGATAMGYLTGGDTYWRLQSFSGTGSQRLECNIPHKFISMPCEDIGRPFVADPLSGEVWFSNRVRVSGAYVPNLSVNNLSSFGYYDYQDINKAYGPIMAMGMNFDTLVCIARYKVQPIYISKGSLAFLSGETQVARSDRIMSVASETRPAAGTWNPESVVFEDGFVYFWDKYNGKVWRYGQDGVTDISGTMSTFFTNIGRQRFSLQNDLCPAGFDRRAKMYLLTFGGAGELTLRTISFKSESGRWRSFHSFIPENYGRVGQNLFTYKTGVQWRHYQGTSANYYGTQYKPEITFVSNQSPLEMKRWHGLRLVTDQQWDVPTITIPASVKYPSGMTSEIKADQHMRSRDGSIYGDFLRDKNDPAAEFSAITPAATKQAHALLRGRYLIGPYVSIRIRLFDGTKAFKLSGAEVYFVTQKQ